MNALHHRPLLPTLLYLGIASVLLTAALLLTATAVSAQGRVNEPGASLTVVNKTRFTASGEIFRGGTLFEELGPGEATALVVPEGRARILVKLLEPRRKLLANALFRHGRGYCLVIYQRGRGPQMRVASVRGADAGAWQGIPDRDCLLVAERYAR